VDVAAQARRVEADRAPQRHLLIAGTGRAGTSFLVRLLTELELDTHVSRFGDGAWDDAAQAGLEFGPAAYAADDMPHVLKSPWAYQFIDESLKEGRITLDAAIIPMRDLIEAASSRTIVELRAIHERAPWMAGLRKSWDDWGHTPGGSVFSLNPIDQARLLAVGFHRLIERLVEADVPILFLAFPRLAEDPDYLFDRLLTVLPPEVTREQMQAAHGKIANGELVRVGRELGRARNADRPPSQPNEVPTLPDLDNAALRREVLRLRESLASANSDIGRYRNTPVRRIARLLTMIIGVLGAK
jgi:hypothetical protein